MHKAVFTILGCCFLLGDLGNLYAQPITGRRHLWIGELWTTEEDIPSGGWEDCFAWPGNHWRWGFGRENRLMNGTVRQGGLSFGMLNWKDWENNFYPYVVGSVNESNIVHPPNARLGCVGHEFKVVLRQPPPTLIVDGELQPPRQEYDALDPNLISDAILYVRWSFDVGLTGEMCYYAYASSPYDCYFYIDFILKNSGNVNLNEKTAELNNQFLHNVAFNYMVQPHVSYEGARQNLAVWEHINDDWVEYYGENYLDWYRHPAAPEWRSKGGFAANFYCLGWG